LGCHRHDVDQAGSNRTARLTLFGGRGHKETNRARSTALVAYAAQRFFSGNAVDIAEWLRQLGLERYEQAFRENAVDLDILPKLRAEDLKEIGVYPVSDRRRLLEAIATLAGESAATSEAQQAEEGRFWVAATGRVPDVGLLLDVDGEYRDQAERGILRKIAPRRFNPSGEAWLPILHSRHGSWDFTALYSNTARAHDLGKVKDWVVIYFHSDSEPEGQCTVVTETQGPLAGKRVVRGREAECRAFYSGPIGGPAVGART